MTNTIFYAIDLASPLLTEKFMSNRAEKAAMNAYPKREKQNKKGTGRFYPNFPRRKAYTEGYEQAEKDLALTAGNIKRISDIIEQMQDEGRNSGFCPPDWWGTEMFYEEVLRRYNESKRTD